MKKTLRIYAIWILLVLFLFLVNGCRKANIPPVVSSVVITPDVVNVNSVASVMVSASDLDNDILSYAYTINGGAITGTGPSVQWTSPAIPGSYELSVTVTDGNGGTAHGKGYITVSQSPTKIAGTASFPEGTTGDLSNSTVNIFTSYDKWLNQQPIKSGEVTGSGSRVSFTLPDLNPGNYYLGIWKDNDNNGYRSVGDFVGWYGTGGLGSPSLTEIQIQDGQTITVSVPMWIL